jgi:PAS domain S-box-containing protein
MIDILRPILPAKVSAEAGASSLRVGRPTGRWVADRLLVPIGAGVAAMLLRALLDPWLDVQLLFVFAFPAVVLSAARGGLHAGIVTASTCVAWSLLPMLPPTPAGSGAVQTGVVMLFALSSLVMCLLVDRLQEERIIAVGRADAAGRATMLQQRLEAALGAAPLTAYDMDLDLRYRWIHNPRAGLDRSAIGRRAEDLLAADVAAPLTALRKRVIQTGRRANHVYTVLECGRRTTYKIFMAPLRDDQARIVGVSNVALDVTDRIEAAELLSRVEERFRVAQALSVDGFTVLRAVREANDVVDFEWEYVNPAAEALFGRSSEELVGRRLLDVLPGCRDHPDLFPRFVRAVESGGADVAEFEYHADGLDGHFRNVAVRLGDGVALTIEDITARKQDEAERIELLQRAQIACREAEEVNRIKDEFLLTISHELRTPLNAIVGWTHLLALRNRAPDLDHGIEVIRRNAQLQTRLIDDLLDVGRIMAGRLTLERCTVGLDRILARAVDATKPAADEKGITLTLQTDDAALPIHADLARLDQIFSNVVTNGVKFTPPGGGVRITSRRDGDFAVVTVADTGEGVAPSFKPYVFDRFRQADGSSRRRHGGLGIGLALARQLTELHGGSIALRSPGQGHGTTVEIRLPLA